MNKKSGLIEASEHANSGNFEAASKLLEQLLKEYSDSSLVSASLANAYWNLERLDDAVTYYKLSISLSPDFEQASLGLFHCLWDQGEKDEAFEEIKRFMLIADSEEYRKIIDEINE